MLSDHGVDAWKTTDRVAARGFFDEDEILYRLERGLGFVRFASQQLSTSLLRKRTWSIHQSWSCTAVRLVPGTSKVHLRRLCACFTRASQKGDTTCHWHSALGPIDICPGIRLIRLTCRIESTKSNEKDDVSRASVVLADVKRQQLHICERPLPKSRMRDWRFS